MKDATETVSTGERFTIRIREKWCKGCEICVEFCPTATLQMKGSTVVVKDVNLCNGCMLCELRCPDFAIMVERRGTEKKKIEERGSNKETDRMTKSA